MKKIIVLVLLAAPLQWHPYVAQAGLFGTVTKKAAGKLIQKPKPVKAPASRTETIHSDGKANTTKPAVNTLTESELAKYQEILAKMDREVLDDIVAKYGVYMGPARMQFAKNTPTTFQDKDAYRTLLRKIEPDLPDAEIENIMGYHLHATRKTYIDRNIPVVPHVTAHERIHQLSSPKFAEQFGDGINEGATSHYALQVRRHIKLIDVDATYPEHRAIYQMMDARVGEEPLAKAYFQGDFRALRQALDDDLGEGFFDTLSARLRNDQFEQAREMLLAPSRRWNMFEP